MANVVLHYGGQEYRLADGEGGLLGGINPTRLGMVEIPLYDGGRLRALFGPGIPAAIVEGSDEPASDVF